MLSKFLRRPKLITQNAKKRRRDAFRVGSTTTGTANADTPRGARGIPSLDGLRALSIALVVYGHSTRGTHGFLRAAEERLELSMLGVRVFFVISGFLITTLLLGEQERRGKISLPRFFFRRAFRIFPAIYVYLSVLLVLSALGVLTFPLGDWGAAAAYVSNYLRRPDWFSGHTWSLSVEEQFYFLWPTLLVLATVPRALRIMAAYVLVAPLLRLATFHLLPDSEWGIERWFPLVADSIGWGCLLAGARRRLAAWPLYRRFQRSGWIWLSPLLIACGEAVLWRHDLSFVLGKTCTNVGIVLALDWVVHRPDTLVGRSLNARPVVLVGAMSYSIYIWQQLFLREGGPPLPAALLCTLACAALSYYAVERPFLRLRDRLDKRWFPHRAGLGAPSLDGGG